MPTLYEGGMGDMAFRVLGEGRGCGNYHRRSGRTVFLSSHPSHKTRKSGAISRAGQPVVLNWTATGASYFIVSPQVGAIRGNTVTVYPEVTTTYTLYATNEYHRSTRKVTVTIQ